jgi:flagellar protein FlbD
LTRATARQAPIQKEKVKMIQLTRLNHDEITINSDLIECLESTPDTLVKLTNGESFMVLESVEEIVQRVVDFRRRIFMHQSLFTV